jgi:tetratricopeptide (TPR) repeat protein
VPDGNNLVNEGLRFHRGGDLQKAEEAYLKVLRAEPTNPDAHHLLGMVHFRQRRFDLSAASISQAIAREPTRAIFHCNLALVHQAAGKAPLAMESLHRSLQLDPCLIEAHNNLGSLYGQAGSFHEAVAFFRQSLRLRPDLYATWVNLGNALNKLRQFDDAAECFYRVVGSDPNHMEALTGLGISLIGRKAFEEAISVLSSCLRINADNAEACYQLAFAYLEYLRTNSEGARLRLREQRGYDHARQPRDNVRTMLRDAEALLTRAVQLRPEFPEAHNSLGVVHTRLMRPQDAIPCYETAIRLRPDYPDPHLNLSLTRLRLGDFTRGWADYEWRWRASDQPRREFAQPLWDGALKPNQAILLHAEQGLGDTLLFFRFASLVRQKCSRLLVECQPELARLLIRTPGIDAVVTRGSVLPSFDAHTPLMSIPRLLGITKETVPADVPYLSCSHDLMESWKNELANVRELKIGIVWQVAPSNNTPQDRSIPLRYFSQLGNLPGIRLYSLQKGRGRIHLSLAADIVDLADRLDDIADTAAAICALDLVITVDTSVAHLAGGLGRPVWTILPFCSDWRWLTDRDDSPWYPTMRLFRQSEMGDWQSVFDKISRQLYHQLLAMGYVAPDFKDRDEVLLLSGHEPRTSNEQSRTSFVDGWQGTEEIALDEAFLREAINANTGQSEALELLADLLVDKGEFSEAADCFRRCAELNSNGSAPLHNLAIVLGYAGRFDESLECFNRLICRWPDAAESHYSRSMLRLRLGDFENGWKEHEWRWRRPHNPMPKLSKPLWDGSDLAGRTLLLLAEQGLGDTIQFVRYASLIKDRYECTIVVACQPELVSLLSTCPGISQVVPLRGDRLPACDVVAPLMSLPWLTGTTIGTIPATIPYLSPDRERIKAWGSRVNADGKRKVGIVWQGRPTHARDRHRSMPLSAFAPLASLKHVRLFSIQKGSAVRSLFDRQNQVPAIDLGGFIQDMADTAAALSHLDLLITIDSAVAHLAGALGIPVWLALPFASEWRWLVGRNDSPWYPSMRLFRQSVAGDWDEVVAKIVVHLAEGSIDPVASLP